MSFIDDLRQGRAAVKSNDERKYRLLQRFTIDQLAEVYITYVGQQQRSAPLLNAAPDSVIGAISNLVPQGKEDTSRNGLIKALSKQMTYETLRAWAKQHKVNMEGID